MTSDYFFSYFWYWNLLQNVPFPYNNFKYIDFFLWNEILSRKEKKKDISLETGKELTTIGRTAKVKRL